MKDEKFTELKWSFASHMSGRTIDGNHATVETISGKENQEPASHALDG